jgi:hypothetical protein
VAVRFHVMLGGFRGMMRGVHMVSMSCVCMMSGLLVIAFRVMFRCFAVMARRVLVMFCSKIVMFAGVL